VLVSEIDAVTLAWQFAVHVGPLERRLDALLDVLGVIQ
jgi:hypothetical protein